MKVLPWVITALAVGSLAQAAVPVLQGSDLHLDAVATVGTGGNFYYRDVVLRRTADGSLRVASAEPRPLVDVHSADTVLIAAAGLDTTVQASVHVTGLTSVACVSLEEPAVTRQDTSFYVLVAETVMPPGSVCASLLPSTPFDLSVPLDIAGLPAATYSVDVNGVVDTFTLASPAP